MSTTAVNKSSSLSLSNIAVVAALGVVFIVAVISGIMMHNAMIQGRHDIAANFRTLHCITALLFIVLGCTHLLMNRTAMARLFTSSPTTWKCHAHQRVLPLYIVAFLCTAVSGIVILCGGHSAIAFHSGIALLFSVLAIFHMAINFGKS